jgi:hypothetical protein
MLQAGRGGGLLCQRLPVHKRENHRHQNKFNISNLTITSKIFLLG